MGSAMIDLNMPILWHIALSDVHVRHDLDTRDQRRMQLFGGRRLLLQKAIDPVPQLNGVLEGNQVNIARPVAQCR